MTLNVQNLNTLIAHLEAQPPERINMGYCFGGRLPSGDTCGCIYIHGDEAGLGGDSLPLGLPPRLEIKLTQPRGWHNERQRVVRYPAHRVISTLKRLRDHYLATGEIVVDWGPEPGQEPAQTWAAPQAVELTPPKLPEEITRLLTSKSDTVEA